MYSCFKLDTILMASTYKLKEHIYYFIIFIPKLTVLNKSEYFTFKLII